MVVAALWVMRGAVIGRASANRLVSTVESMSIQISDEPPKAFGSVIDSGTERRQLDLCCSHGACLCCEIELVSNL